MIKTYNDLERIVSPHVKLYRDDLIKHDRKILEEYDGPFLYGYRETGTDLIRMKPGTLKDWFPDMMYQSTPFTDKVRMKDEEEAEKTLMGELIWVTRNSGNKNFLYYDGKTLSPVTEERVKLLWRNYVKAVVMRSEFQMPGSIAITDKGIFV